MRNHRYPCSRRPARAALALAIATLFSAVTALPAQAQYVGEVRVESSDASWLYDLGAVVSIFVDAPMAEPEPVAIGWAPPPMLVEELPSPPDQDAVWTGGYWTWQGDWVWCAGRWLVPPRPQYVWVQPYYEHRDDRVIFLPGYWSRPDVEFVAPSYDQQISWADVGANVVVGPPPMGPAGIFIPPPPGSRPGIIIPAPVGTPPAVILGAPPVMNVGMSVRGNVSIDSHNTGVNDNRVTNYNVTNVRNVTNVVIQAPAGATANGRAFEATVPHQARLAAAQRPVVSVRAPAPASRTAVQAYVPGRTVAALPPPQRVQGLPTVPSHPVAVLSQAQRGQMAHAPIVPMPRGASPAAETGPKAMPTASALAQTRPIQAGPGGDARPRSWPTGQPPAPNAQVDEQARQHAQQQAEQQAEQQRVQADERTQQAQQAQQAQQQQRNQAAAQAQQREQQQAQQQRAQTEQRAQQAQQQQRNQAAAQAQQREQQQAQQQRAQTEQRSQQAQQQQRAQSEAQAQQREQQQAQQQAQQQRAQAEEQARQRAQQAAQPARPADADARSRQAPRASGPANGHPTTEEERSRQGQGG